MDNSNFTKVQEHCLSSYFTLRTGIAVLGILFPLILWIGGAFEGIRLQSSMSAYYHATAIDGAENGTGPMRNFLVGILWALGSFLFLYKGYSKREDWVLNLAGIFAVFVALIPTDPPTAPDRMFTWHGTFAILLFFCMAIVCIFCQNETLDEFKKNEELKKYYKLFFRTYRTIGYCMIILPGAAFLLPIVFSSLKEYKFIAEAAAITVFSGYWIIKGIELKKLGWEQLPDKSKGKETNEKIQAPGEFLEKELISLEE